MRLLIFMIILGFSSCNQQKSDTTNEYERIIGKEILLIKNLDIKESSEFRLVSYISQECTPCTVEDIYLWQEYYNKNRNLFDIDIILNTRSEKDAYKMIKEFNLDIKTYLDDKNEFLTLNELPDDTRFHTLLLHKSKVIAIGNPITNPKIHKIFIRAIEKYSN